jgi:hypothetical protein
MSQLELATVAPCEEAAGDAAVGPRGVFVPEGGLEKSSAANAVLGV